MNGSKSDARRVLEFLRDERAKCPDCLVESPWRKEVVRRGNFTMVRVQVWRPGSLIGEGVGFAKRDPTRYRAPGFRFDVCPAWRQDQYDAKRGEEVAMGRAMLDLAWALLKAGEMVITPKGEVRWRTEADEDDAPF
jgi:hypothetical protein